MPHRGAQAASLTVASIVEYGCYNNCTCPHPPCQRKSSCSCILCGSCADACPAGVIHYDFGSG
ncbi:MAG: 4Fe-4S binding protein [Spirochaetota bacterium]